MGSGMRRRGGCVPHGGEGMLEGYCYALHKQSGMEISPLQSPMRCQSPFTVVHDCAMRRQTARLTYSQPVCSFSLLFLLVCVCFRSSLCVLFPLSVAESE